MLDFVFVMKKGNPHDPDNVLTMNGHDFIKSGGVRRFAFSVEPRELPRVELELWAKDLRYEFKAGKATITCVGEKQTIVCRGLTEEQVEIHEHPDGP